MNVLLMSVKAGFGHHSTALAMMSYFEKFSHRCEMLDIFNYINKPLGTAIDDGYLFSTKYMPNIYGKAYEKLDKKDEPYDKRAPISLVSNLVSKKLTKYVEEYAPDLIIGTHSVAGMVMSILSKRGVISCPTIGIITDFTVHPFWESTDLDYYVTPDEILNYEMAKKGVSGRKILPIGIPIREKFSVRGDKAKARAALNIHDKTTALVMMGSMGYGNIKKMLMEMDEFQSDFQIICVCGSNKKAYAEINDYIWKKEVYAYGFTDKVDMMMDAADFIVSKPGGLTTSEALAKGLPMIIINPLPGQEDRNLDFLVNNGAAVMVNERYSISDALNQLLNCEWRRRLIEESVGRLGKPSATADLYKFVTEKLWANSTGTENALPVK